MLTLENNRLVVRFPELHADAQCSIEFQRTLRIPDDNRVHKLPPGLGAFPLFHVEDYAHKLPAAWSEHGGVFLPMHQAEAMWIRFSSAYPFAVKIAAGKINAVSGEPWSQPLKPPGRWVGPAHSLPARDPREAQFSVGATSPFAKTYVPGKQDYVTLPEQPWLDGFNVGANKIRQFVAMPLGSGYSVEEQITGEALHGGLQIIVYPLHPAYYVKRSSSILRGSFFGSQAMSAQVMTNSCADMGLAPGGMMEQSIFEDKRGIEKWDQSRFARCFVHLLNSAQFAAITGQQPPTQAPTAAEYTRYGLPWFEYYGEGRTGIPGAYNLSQLDSVAALGHKKGETPLPENEPVGPTLTKKVYALKPGEISSGQF